MSTPSLPIILVTGFLGSGKTTLMRRLIMDAHRRGLRAAVVVNEFGSADVDSNILREADAELVASIAGGCACCSGQGELHEALEELGSQPMDARPDVVLLEASGLADPVTLLDVMTAASLLPLVRVAAVASVVDGARYLELATTLAPLLRRQVELADLIVLNKRDIAKQLPQVAAVLRTANPRAQIVETEQCALDLGVLWSYLNEEPASQTASRSHLPTALPPLPPALKDRAETTSPVNGAGRGAKNMDTRDEIPATTPLPTPTPRPSAPGTRHPTPDTHPPTPDARHPTPDTPHSAHTVFCPLPHPMERAALEEALSGLPMEVWRAKGFVHLRGEASLQLVQYTGGGASGGRFQIVPFFLPAGSDEPAPGLVFIGSALDREALFAAFSGNSRLIAFL